jgi:oxalate decarboxylase
MRYRNRQDFVARRSMLGVLAAAPSGIGSRAAFAQTRAQTLTGEQNHSASNPGPINKVLAGENPNSSLPPITDSGNLIPIWYFFDLALRRIQDGGWTRQVTARELPSSQDLAGVNLRLTAGSYRGLHCHTANEWAYMLYGSARVTVFNPQDGTIFIGDGSEGGSLVFPDRLPAFDPRPGAGRMRVPPSLRSSNVSEYSTSLLSGWLAHTPSNVLSGNLNLPESVLATLPTQGLYIFPGNRSRTAGMRPEGGRRCLL